MRITDDISYRSLLNRVGTGKAKEKKAHPKTSANTIPSLVRHAPPSLFPSSHNGRPVDGKSGHFGAARLRRTRLSRVGSSRIMETFIIKEQWEMDRDDGEAYLNRATHRDTSKCFHSSHLRLESCSAHGEC